MRYKSYFRVDFGKLLIFFETAMIIIKYLTFLASLKAAVIARRDLFRVNFGKPFRLFR